MNEVLAEDVASTAVAQRLLGAVLSTFIDGDLVAVRVTETEAYAGSDDPASHAYKGVSARTVSLFGPAGRLYVYRHLGLHQCVNLVCGPPGRGPAVLFRAGEVIEGADVAQARRTAHGVCRHPRDLARGPGRFTVALGLGRDPHDGMEVALGTADADHPVALRWPARSLPAGQISSSARIGVAAAGADPIRFGWRWWISDSEAVSAHRRALETLP